MSPAKTDLSSMTSFNNFCVSVDKEFITCPAVQRSPKWSFSCFLKSANAPFNSVGLLVCCFTSGAVEFPWSREIFRENAITSPASGEFVTIRSSPVRVSLNLLRHLSYTPTWQSMLNTTRGRSSWSWPKGKKLPVGSALTIKTPLEVTLTIPATRVRRA